MALMRDLSAAQLAFQVTGGPVDDFLVVRFRGTEGLCQLYRFEIDLVSTQEKVEFDSIVGKGAVLSINTSAGERWFHGIVSRFEMTGETYGQTCFRAELVPAVWLLTHRYNCRIFQQKTVPQIISDVLTLAGIASDRVKLTLKGQHDPRDYCVQYRETDYNFICRLMEEEGIWWYFQQTQSGHIFTLADDASAYTPMEGDPKLEYQPPTGLNVEAEHIFRFRLGQSVRPGKAVLNDFSFEDPRLNLQAKCASGRDEGLEFSDYPGEYTKQAAGTALAKLRAEEFESGRILGIGQSNSHRLTPGCLFDLAQHPSESLNASYLVTSLLHQGEAVDGPFDQRPERAGGLLDARVHQALVQAHQSQDPAIRELAEALLQIAARLRTGDLTAHRAMTSWLFHAGQVSRDLATVAGALGADPLQALSVPNLLDDTGLGSAVDEDATVYECRFECIPADVAFRPPRVTPWPVMRGSQTARVVGPTSEEIYCDKYGRVKVQFNWDREGKFDDKASCWIRVAQGMAGGAYGMLFLPRVGQEVIVDFLEGDPDKPIITGRVYNADHMPAYTLPDEKTKSYIKTHSSKGGGGTNEIRFEDLKDKEQILLNAQKDLHVRVKNLRVENVEADRHLTVGNKKYEKVGKDSHLKIGQDSLVEITRDNNVTVKGKESIKITGTCSHEVTGDVVEKFGSNHKHEVQMTYAAKALSIKLEASTGIELKCGGSSIVLTPAAIFIVGGPLVNINSGSGPPVSPVTAGATAPAAPADPATADKVKPGKDTTYSGGEELAAATAPPDVAGHEFELTEVPEKPETTWVDIELVDEEGLPIPGEEYRVVDSAGTVKEGTLDANGRAHVTGIAPGPVQQFYPNLDMDTWERT